MAHFYETLPEGIRSLSNQHAVERYIAGATVPGETIQGLSPQQLNSFPVPGTWSIQQIVMHLTDTDSIAAYRMKRIIAEDGPRVDVYDENAFASRLGYDKLDAMRTCELFKINRRHTGDMLRLLPDAAFDRIAKHPEIGDITLGQLLRLYVHHLDHHIRFATDKRRMLEGR